MNVNKVILVGRLTRDPELRNTNSGQPVATINLATNRFWTDQSGQKQEQTEFHRVVMFGRLAETVSQYLIKGQEAYIEGRLQTRSYTDKSGVEKYTTEVIANDIQFGSKPQGSNSGTYNQNISNQNQAVEKNNENDTKNNVSGETKNTSEEEIPTINLDEEDDEIKIEDVPF